MRYKVESLFGASVGPLTQPAFTSIGQSGPAVRLEFTGGAGLSYSILQSTNVALPLTNWTLLGSGTEISPGLIQFSDTQATNNPQRYYRVRRP